ncbi:MAG TPA: hypothetical protein VGC72_11415 [Candidatus Elarobacter sp.]|jgi:hypothetical protein
MADALVPIYVFGSPDVERILAENGVSLAELLRRDGVDVQQTHGTNPVATPGGGDKEPVTIFLLSVAAIATLTPILTNAWGRLTHHPLAVEETVVEPMLDAGGAPLLGPDGTVLTRWVRRSTPVMQDVETSAFGVTLKLAEH